MYIIKADLIGCVIDIDAEDRAISKHRMRYPLACSKCWPGGERLQLLFGEADMVLCLAHQTVRQLSRVFQQRAVNIEDEPRRHAGRAVCIAPLVVRQKQSALRARHTDKRQPPLLLHRGHGLSFGRGEYALAQAAQEHIGELQPLGRVHGHQLDRLPPHGCIAVRKQRDVGQVILERTFLPAGIFIFIDRLLELGQVVQTLLATLSAQHFLIAAPVQQRGKHLGDGFPRVIRREVLDQMDKLPHLCGVEQLMLQIALQRFIKRAAILFCILLDKAHALLP